VTLFGRARLSTGPRDVAPKPPVELVTLETYLAIAATAAKPDVHAELDDLPLVGAAWVWLLEPYDVAESYGCYRYGHGVSVALADQGG
jgi:hypothetical protein